MNGDRCSRKGCTGTIDDGYCDVCGLAEGKAAVAAGAFAGSTAPTAAGPAAKAASNTRTAASGTVGSSSVSASHATGSGPMSRSGKGSRRSTRSSSRSSRKQLGAGLITLPDLPSTDPEKAILASPKVPEHKRFCASCNNPLKRENGFCGKCGQRYSFIPTLNPGDVVAGQYEVKGALAYGGLGWIYLGFDKVLSRYVVLKGLLNVHDPASAAVALAERQFLASVKHPNIVGIYNFVQNGGEGFIVMEYIGGKTLKQIRQERGPLPVAESIAYVHRILPAFSYLHQTGLVYCDFKPDNVMLERDDVKLIDMGGVRRVDDMQGDIYGTVGYSAPEAGSGPTVASDLFTIGRTLAVLVMQIPGFSSDHLYTLPAPAEHPVLAQNESLHRFLLKATAHKPEDRFESADEMGDQLLGVLREVVSIDSGEPKPGASVFFGSDGLAFESGKEMEPVAADPSMLPIPVIDMSDPGARMATIASHFTDSKTGICAIRKYCEQIASSRELRFRLVRELMRVEQFSEAAVVLDALGAEDAWDWRVQWYQGLAFLAQNRALEACAKFDQVYFDLPGETAPKLALGLASELANMTDIAIKMYDLVARQDPGYVSACFGLARCLTRKGDRKGAIEALNRVPHTSGIYPRARVTAARLLAYQPDQGDLPQAAEVAEGLMLQGVDQFRLSSIILQSALEQITAGKLQGKGNNGTILGHPMNEAGVRLGLEKSLRALAKLSSDEDRVRLIDRANQVRPVTLV